jgi:tetraacyldisaccharide 4'-kinase
MEKNKNFFSVLFLGIFSILYGIVISFRNFFYDSKIIKSEEFKIPIISVGNISVGGTGKTPHAEYLVDLLKDEFNIAVLSRGYKRKSKGFRIIEATDTHFDAGDEPLQIKQKYPSITVAVCKRREYGIRKIQELYPEVNIVILDDAFQYRKVVPGISILLNDYNNPIAHDYLLPLGRLREYKSASHRADFLIYTKCPTELKPIDIRILNKDIDTRPFQYLFFSTLKYSDLIPVFSENPKIELYKLSDFNNILLVTGIAKPNNLFNFLKAKNENVAHLAYSDHHNFSKKDINTISKTFSLLSENKIIVVTDKDAVRLKSKDFIPDEIKERIFSIPIKVEFLCYNDDKNQFEKLVTNYVRNNQAYNRLV